jgi:probable HAF family extracellular repeat protein
MIVGASDTAAADPYAPGMCFADCYVIRSFLWSNGKRTELAPLPGGRDLSSIASSINALGWSVGQAQNGTIDPATGWPESRAVLWRGNRITDLGFLGGAQGIANALNDRGEVVGASATATMDSFASTPLTSCIVVLGVVCNGSTFAGLSLFYPVTTETHAFLWQGNSSSGGSMHDLGTLGGPDSTALMINDRGEVVGYSFTSFTPNASTGIPTVEPFIWSPEDGKMISMGSLGGTFGAPWAINNHGEVTGSSNLVGDQTEHPFIWSKAHGMRDLGTLGGTFGHPDAINGAGDVVGYASTPGDQAAHAFLWRDGAMLDLGTIGTDPTSEAFSINSHGEVVGGSSPPGIDLHGFIWEDGGPMMDLNLLTVPGSDLIVTSALLINDRGEIGCLGQLADGTTHPCVLIPCDDAHPGVEGCDYSPVDTRSVVKLFTTPQESRGTPSASRGRTAQSDRRGSSIWRRHLAPIH